DVGRGEQVLAGAAARPRRGVTGPEHDHVLHRVDGRRVPHGGAAGPEPERAGRPRLAADVTRLRDGEEPPEEVAVGGVVGADAAAEAELASRGPDVDDAVVVE